MTQEALELALEFIEQINKYGWKYEFEAQMYEAITAIKEALAQEQEPAAYLCENAVGHKYFRWKKPSSTYKPIALYTTPPQQPWAGLTEDEAIELLPVGDWEVESTLEFACAVEAKLKEKNA